MRLAVTRVALVLAFALAVTSIGPAPTHAQHTLLLTLFTSGQKAYEKGNYREALRIFLQCKEIAEKTSITPDHRAIMLQGLAETMRSLGMYKEAEPTFREALAVSETVPLRQNSTLPLIFNSMALLYQNLGRFAEAEAMWKQAEALTAKGDPNRTSSFLPVNNLARLYFTWGKIDEGAEYTQKAVRIAKKAPRTLALCYSDYNRGYLAFQRGQYGESEKAYKQGLEHCGSMFGKSHLYYSIVLTELAELYRKQSRYQDAGQALEEVLKIREATFAGDNPDITETRIQIGRVLCEEGKYAQAKEYIQRALKDSQTILGDKDNFLIGKAKHCMGNIYRQYGRYQDSEDMLNEALAAQEKVLGPDHLDVATLKRDLALVSQDRGNFSEAETLLKESLNAVEARTGPDHPDRAAAANALAHLYLRDGKLDAAQPLLKKSLELSERVLGENNTVTAAGARDLGELYLKQKNYTGAASCLQRALAINEALYGEKAPQLAADLMTLATIYGATGQSAQADPLLKRAAEIKNVLPGGESSASIQADQTPKAASSEFDRPVRDKWALVVGVSNFKDSSINLKYAAKDATDFSNFLVTSQKFKPDHVKLLTDDAATRENVIGMLGEKWLGAHAGPDDLVLVYVSSHGSQAQNDAGGVNFLVAHDTNKNSLAATGIPMQWLTKIVSEQVNSNRVVLILDVCHSGSAGEGGKALVRSALYDLNPKNLKIGKGQMIICSSLANQISWESKNYENSVFTRRLMEALESKKDETTILDAYRQLKVLVEAEVLRDRGNLQTPVLWNQHWIGKEPVIAVETTK